MVLKEKKKNLYFFIRAIPPFLFFLLPNFKKNFLPKFHQIDSKIYFLTVLNDFEKKVFDFWDGRGLKV